MNKQWFNEFKLALIEENTEKIESLLDELDLKTLTINLSKDCQDNHKEFQKILDDNLIQLQALLQEAIKLINIKKDGKAIEIQKVQKVLKYFKA